VGIDMKEIGLKIQEKVKESLFGLMGIGMMEIGIRIRSMVMEFIKELMVIDI